uniref:Uncharacterized protein n=1 Tax=Magallana gigas TaxID=29159 RepID=K1QTI2_MAGGI
MAGVEHRSASEKEKTKCEPSKRASSKTEKKTTIVGSEEGGIANAAVNNVHNSEDRAVTGENEKKDCNIPDITTVDKSEESSGDEVPLGKRIPKKKSFGTEFATESLTSQILKIQEKQSSSNILAVGQI